MNQGWRNFFFFSLFFFLTNPNLLFVLPPSFFLYNTHTFTCMIFFLKLNSTIDQILAFGMVEHFNNREFLAVNFNHRHRHGVSTLCTAYFLLYHLTDCLFYLPTKKACPKATTRYLFYKNHVYKNVEAQKCLFFKNIIVILLVAISISFEPQVEI